MLAPRGAAESRRRGAVHASCEAASHFAASRNGGHAVPSSHMLTDLPNLLTLSRIAAIPVLVVLMAVRHPAANLAACVVFSAAAITDYWDGRIARSRRQLSDFGRMLDPIADKLLVGAALMMLAGMGGFSGWTLYPAVVILLREILVSGLREYLAGIRVGLPVTRLAKWKTGFQMGALGTLLAGDPSARLLHLSFLPVRLIGVAMLWMAAALTLVTGWDYLTAGLRHATGERRGAPVQPNAVPPP
jgi:cardiolipin synthase (CMP-forming)